MKKITSFLFLFAVTLSCLQAQNDEEGRFTATILAGACFAQIDGDDAAGFNKVGFNGGVRGGVRFGEPWELCTEILFSQKGSYVRSVDRTYHLDYAEVPVMFYYKDWKAQDAKSGRKFRRVMVGAGLYYARLINTRIRQFGNTLDPSSSGYIYMAPNEFGFALDGNIFITRQIGINLRWSRSITSIVDESRSPAFGYAINRTIVVRALFRL